MSQNKNFVKGTKTKSWKLKEDHNILIYESKVQISKSSDSLSCDLCGAKFAQKRNLGRHFQTVHEKKMSFKCLISAWGQSREWVLHKHKCIQFIARVPKARVLWTVCTSACAKPIPEIVPMLKLHSLLACAFIMST